MVLIVGVVGRLFNLTYLYSNKKVIQIFLQLQVHRQGDRTTFTRCKYIPQQQQQQQQQQLHAFHTFTLLKVNKMVAGCISQLLICRIYLQNCRKKSASVIWARIPGFRNFNIIQNYRCSLAILSISILNNNRLMTTTTT